MVNHAERRSTCVRAIFRSALTLLFSLKLDSTGKYANIYEIIIKCKTCWAFDLSLLLFTKKTKKRINELIY